MLTQTQSWLVLTFLLAFVTTAPLFGGFIAVVFVNAIASLLVFVGIIRLVLISKPAVLEAFPAPDDLELVLNKPKKKRAYWIDRLKVFLTIIVVMHHRHCNRQYHMTMIFSSPTSPLPFKSF